MSEEDDNPEGFELVGKYELGDETVKETPGELERMWEEQKRFNSQLVALDTLKEHDKMNLGKDYLLMMMDELSKLGKLFPFRPHVFDAGKKVDRRQVKEELVDIFKFGQSIALTYGITSEEFEREWWRKSRTVQIRWDTLKMLKDPDRQFIICDIDGVVADFITTWLRYINDELGTELTYKTHKSYHVSDYSAMKAYEEERLKKQFSASGMFASLEPYKSSITALQDLIKRNRYTLLFLTSRDDRHGIPQDTVEWLSNQDIMDGAGLLFARHKRTAMLDHQLLGRTRLFIDDKPEDCHEMHAAGIKVMSPARPWNASLLSGEVHVFTGWDEVLGVLE